MIHKRSCTAFRKLICVQTQRSSEESFRFFGKKLSDSQKKPSDSSEKTFRFSEEAFRFSEKAFWFAAESRRKRILERRSESRHQF